MNAQTNLIAQLDDALGQSDIGRRAEILRQVTDLFVAGSGSFAGEQISLFDDVMSRLLAELEVAARASFGLDHACTMRAPAVSASISS